VLTVTWSEKDGAALAPFRLHSRPCCGEPFPFHGALSDPKRPCRDSSLDQLVGAVDQDPRQSAAPTHGRMCGQATARN
jgi:hypothetical protein